MSGVNMPTGGERDFTFSMRFFRRMGISFRTFPATKRSIWFRHDLSMADQHGNFVQVDPSSVFTEFYRGHVSGALIAHLSLVEEAIKGSA